LKPASAYAQPVRRVVLFTIPDETNPAGKASLDLAQADEVIE
jgi:hypothetical protein